MRLFFLFTGIALLLTGCFSPWLWAPNAVTGALGLAGEIAKAEDKSPTQDITIVTNAEVGGAAAVGSDLDVINVNFSVFDKAGLGKADHSWADGLN